MIRKISFKSSDWYDLLRGGMFVLLAAGTSLFITRFTFESFNLPKTAWIEFWIKALFCTTLIGVLFKRPFRLMLSPVTGVLALYLLLNLVSGFAAESRSLWWDEVRRIFFLFLFFLMIQDWAYGNRRRVFLLIWGLSLSACITALWVLGEDFSARFFPEYMNVRPRLGDWRGFLAAGLGNSGYVADYIAVLFPLNILLYLHVRGKLLEIYTLFAIMASYAALVVCWSIQSNAGVILALLVLAVYLLKYKPAWFWRRRKLRLELLFLGFLLITIFFISPLPINPHNPSIFTQAFSSKRWHYGGESRLVIWSQSLEIVKGHPWLGTGAGNFTFQYVQQSSPYLLSEPGRLRYIGMYSNAAHNELLHSWSELGFLGPALLFVLIVILIRTLIRPIEETSPVNRWIRVGALCGLVCSFFPSMMAYPLRLPTSSVLFFLLCGLPGILVPHTKFFSDTVMIPVEFNWNALRISVFLENFHRPVGGTIQLVLSRLLRWLLAVLVILCLIPWEFQTIRPIISDALFKRGKMVVEYHNRGMSSPGMERVGIEAMEHALVWWPEHHDCRSTLGQFLVRLGRYREATYHLYITTRRLQAGEIYEHLGLSLDAIGNRREAIMAYTIFFERNPIMIFAKPGLYRRYRNLSKNIGGSESGKTPEPSTDRKGKVN